MFIPGMILIYIGTALIALSFGEHNFIYAFFGSIVLGIGLVMCGVFA